jgi:hypothetical protein
MKHLQISALPCLRTDDSDMQTVERDGFVDDKVILALLSGTPATRPPVDMGELALAADEMDFAGWKLSHILPEGTTGAVFPPPESNARRPAPPVLEEPGLGQPHHGSHRWWLAGLAGTLSTLLLSLLLLSLSSREQSRAPLAEDRISIIEAPPGTRISVEMPGIESLSPASELTVFPTAE